MPAPDRATSASDLLGRALAQYSLQRAPVHVEPARGFRDVAAAQLVDSLNVLPTHPVGRHRIVRRYGGIAFDREQCRYHVVGIDWLGEIINGTKLHRIHRGRDIAVTGEDEGT